MNSALVIMLVLLPIGVSLAMLFRRVQAGCFGLITATAAVLATSALLLMQRVPFRLTFSSPVMHDLALAADFGLLGLFGYYGFKHRHLLIAVLVLLQAVLLAGLEFFLLPSEILVVTLVCDHLALIMILIASVVGSVICIQATVYMQHHEAHAVSGASRQGFFFFVMLLFLGAMNGLLLCNDLRLFYLFFETTTLCSFLLIAFDQTPTAVANALRALWINNLAGLAFVAALVLLYRSAGVIDLLGLPHGVTPFMVSAIALLCLAAFIKAAQFPFQGWLLGAMVAPTPVSALLHSSTMVKIGVYLVLRLSPTIAGSFFAQCVAVYGAFCFVAAAALAVGQSNGKKVLAYSTVSNLGLIMACAGIGTASALTAGLVLILFHALTKALLFLCIGAIEQRLESRDIEDMRGLYATMPVTALITVAGVIMMIMPPFGMLLGKWMALESAAAQLPVITMTAVGSALTVMYWARWAGALMNDPYGGQLTLEIQEKRTWFALGLLAGLAGLLSLSAPWICKWLILPIAGSHSPLGYMVHGGTVVNALGAFAVFPLGLAAMAGFLLSVLAVKRAAKARKVSPYLGGAQLAEAGWFRGPQNQPVQASAKNYYLSHVFGEKLLTPWLNLVALTLLALIMGGTL